MVGGLEERYVTRSVDTRAPNEKVAYTGSSTADSESLSSSSIKKLKCDECHLYFSKQSRLERHRLTHSAIRPECCLLCSRSFKRKEHLKRHLISVHSDYLEERRNDQGVVQIGGLTIVLTSHSCEICTKTFNTKDHLNRHKKIHAKNQVEKESNRLKYGGDYLGFWADRVNKSYQTTMRPPGTLPAMDLLHMRNSQPSFFPKMEGALFMDNNNHNTPNRYMMVGNNYDTRNGNTIFRSKENSVGQPPNQDQSPVDFFLKHNSVNSSFNQNELIPSQQTQPHWVPNNNFHEVSPSEQIPQNNSNQRPAYSFGYNNEEEMNSPQMNHVQNNTKNNNPVSPPMGFLHKQDILFAEDSLEEGLFRCTVCAALYTRKSNLRKHINNVHSSTTSPQHCAKCQRAFAYKHTLARHQTRCQGSSLVADDDDDQPF